MSGAQISTQISVDTQAVRSLADSVRRAEAEARTVLELPHLLAGSMAAMSPSPGGATARAAAEFLHAWRQALADATDELRLLSAGLDLAAQLYDTTQRVNSDRHGITLTGGIR